MANVDQYINEANQNRAAIQQTGANLQGTTADQNNYYSGLQDNYRQQADQAYSDLQQTPGYTADQAAAIQGNPNAAMGYYHPEQTAADAGNNAADLKNQVGTYQGNLEAAADNVNNVGGQAAAGLYNGVTGAASGLQSGLNSAVAKSASDLQNPANEELSNLGGTYGYLKGANDQAVDQYGNALQSATDPSKLTVDQNFKNNYALSPEQAQNIKDVAAQTTGGQFQSMRDQAGINAAAEGNTSPVALAAIQQQLGRTGAIAAGNAASAAELQANQVAADRQKDIETMSLGANQDLATRQTQNAGNIYTGQTQNAANLSNLEAAGTKDVAANQQNAASQSANMGYGAAATGGQAAIDAAKSGNQAMIDAANTGSAAKYAAANTGGAAGIDASKTSGAQTLATDQANQTTGQTLAGNADTAASARAGKVADTSITGQNNYRGYLTGQQGAAQQGSQTATSQGIQNAGATASGINQAQQTANSTATANNANNTAGANANKDLVGNIAKMFADGGIADEPTDAIIGEKGPEAVIPLDQNQGYGGQMDVSGWRGDGQAVPGNQPGGANGAFGRYGQSNGQQPTDGFKSQVAQMAKSNVMNSPGGQMISGLHKRYGQQGQQHHAMNSQQSQMRSGMQQSNADQMQNQAGDTGGKYIPPKVPFGQNALDLSKMSGGDGAASGGDYTPPKVGFGQNASDLSQMGGNSPSTQQPSGNGVSSFGPMDGGGSSDSQNQAASQGSFGRYGGAPEKGQGSSSFGPMTQSSPMSQNQAVSATQSQPSQTPPSQGSGTSTFGAPTSSSPMGQNQAASATQTPPPAQAQPQTAAAPAAPKNTMASPFGQMNFGGAPQMKSGQIVTKPTRAIIGEHGPEAVVPLDGHAGSRITPGMMGNLMPKRYDATGPTALHGPMRPMKPAMSDPKMSNWKRYDSQHAGA